MSDPKGALINGVRILKPTFRPTRFHFRFRGMGCGSGGNYAWGEFVRKNRRLELHFRYSLGLVRYHIDEQSASHETYMRELGVFDRCRYPGFSDDPMSGFENLAHDLAFADDFLIGSANLLREAAAKEAAVTAAEWADTLRGHVGDKRRVERMHVCFREKQYAEVVKLARELKYPDQVSESEKKMVAIAEKRARSSPA